MIQPIKALKTIIIPAAGKGTRMLPATQVTAKELLPVYDRPVIQFAIDEAIETGAERIIVVVSAAKPAIREFLGDTAKPSGDQVARAGKSIATPEILYVEQTAPSGLGDAILCCRGLILPGPFGIILPDDLIIGRACLSEMVEHYQEGHMIAAMKVAEQDTCHYGIFALRGAATDLCIPAVGMVEKPPHGAAPSAFAAVGRYILQPMIFDVLARTPKGAGGELQLTDAIAIATHSVPLTAFRFSGSRYDCGSHDGLLAASNARQAAVRADRLVVPLSAARQMAKPERPGTPYRSDYSGSLGGPAYQAI